MPRKIARCRPGEPAVPWDRAVALCPIGHWLQLMEAYELAEYMQSPVVEVSIPDAGGLSVVLQDLPRGGEAERLLVETLMACLEICEVCAYPEPDAVDVRPMADSGTPPKQMVLCHDCWGAYQGGARTWGEIVSVRNKAWRSEQRGSWEPAHDDDERDRIPPSAEEWGG